MPALTPPQSDALRRLADRASELETAARAALAAGDAAVPYDELVSLGAGCQSLADRVRIATRRADAEPALF